MFICGENNFIYIFLVDTRPTEASLQWKALLIHTVLMRGLQECALLV
jgi:hypothetical protein